MSESDNDVELLHISDYARAPSQTKVQPTKKKKKKKEIRIKSYWERTFNELGGNKWSELIKKIDKLKSIDP